MDELLAQLSDTNPDVRRDAAYELGETHDIAAVPHLLALLTDDLYVRVHAIQALRELGDRSATAPLCSLIAAEAPHRLIMSNTCRALGAIADERAIPTLQTLLLSPEPFARYDAAFALGEIGHESAIPTLRGIADDQTMPVYEDEDGDCQETIYSVGEQAKRAIDMIPS